MRNKILIILGIFFAIAVSNISISVYLISNDGTIETYLKNPKSSGYWTMNFIHIDDNWSATAIAKNIPKIIKILFLIKFHPTIVGLHKYLITRYLTFLSF